MAAEKTAPMTPAAAAKVLVDALTAAREELFKKATGGDTAAMKRIGSVDSDLASVKRAASRFEKGDYGSK
jgi:hypothetical protein